MKNLLLLITLFSLILNGWSQEPATFSGEVRDETDDTAISFASVVILTETDRQLVGGTLTDENGFFQLQIKGQGSFLLQCQALGYQQETLELYIGEKNRIFDLGIIRLNPQLVVLDEVLLEATQSGTTQELDKRTFNLADNPAQAGGSVLDAMRAMPGITVDQEGNVLLRGSDQVQILIDGKQSSLTGFGNQQGLANLPAANIDRIEIINNPSAKYDASGMAGIINLIYKEEKKQGWNGQAGLALGVGQLTQRRADQPTDLGSYQFNPKYIPSLNLQYNRAQFRSFFQGEVLRQRKLPNNEFTFRSYEDGRQTASQVPENRTQTQYILSAGFDWDLNSANTLRFSTLLDYESHIDTAQIRYRNLLSQQTYRYWHWKEDEVTGYFNLRLDFQHRFEEAGHELNLSGQFTRGWEDEQYFLNDSNALRIAHDTTHIIAPENTSVFLLDYVKPLRSGKLEAGTKFQLRSLPVSYAIGRGPQSVIAPGLGAWSDWGETILAAYLNYLLERKHLDIEAGLRAEQVFVYYDIDPANIYYPQNDAYDYFQVYPNIRISPKLNEWNQLSIFYNRRVDRPGEPQLRIFPKYDDPELLKVGNPYLRPQFTQTVELAYKRLWHSGSFFFAGYFRLIDAPFLRIYETDLSTPDYQVINKIYQNVGEGSQLGLELQFDQRILKNWKLSASLNVYNNVIEAYSGTLLFPTERSFGIERSEELTWDLKINQQFDLPGAWDIQLTGLYLAPQNIPQGRQLARSSIDLGLRKTILQEKGQITFSATDLFNRYGIKQEIRGDGFTAVYENFYETQVLRLGFVYKF
jgi:outer membrane receptor protein involved in Fe transport